LQIKSVKIQQETNKELESSLVAIGSEIGDKIKLVSVQTGMSKEIDKCFRQTATKRQFFSRSALPIRSEKKTRKTSFKVI
jgi:hypothetical protein